MTLQQMKYALTIAEQGVQRNYYDIIVAAVIVLVLIVQVIQIIGNIIAKKTEK